MSRSTEGHIYMAKVQFAHPQGLDAEDQEKIAARIAQVISTVVWPQEVVISYVEYVKPKDPS